MAKQFIKVSKTYATKNSIQLLILQKLQSVDFTLTSDISKAKYFIKKAYDDAVNQYKGKAAIPELKEFSNGLTIVFFVEDVIYINVYSTLYDLS